MPQSYGRIEGDLKSCIPVGRRLVVKPFETPDYKGSIILPDSVKSLKPTTGVVVALSAELAGDELFPVKEGDVIVYSQYSGMECKFDTGERVLCLSGDDVQMILGESIQLEVDKE